MSRVSEVRYVGYGVPDIASERAFYRDAWGLVEAGEQGDRVHFAAPGHDELYVVRLRPSERKRIDVIALAADSKADVEGLYRQVKEAGAKIICAPRTLETLGGGYGFQFFSPDGMPFEISSGVTRGSSRELARWEAVPERISHIVLHSPDHKAATQFFVDALGFKLSDWIGDFMSFLRCNEWHHRIAFLPGPPCLNHVAYDMRGLDDVLRGVSRLKEMGVGIQWGPGRHTAGDNVFSYFVTPNGFTVEYTAELERIDDASWQPHVYPPSARIMDQWGIGVGGPQTMPKPAPDGGVFQPPPV
jgi:catechol 2,3-dioxygenase-like lactoylglutathione lyase family enzyme